MIPLQGAQVQILGGELRSHILPGMAKFFFFIKIKKINTNYKKRNIILYNTW